MNNNIKEVQYHARSDLAKVSWITEDSYILTDKGWRPAWAINVGDRVMINTLEGVLSFETIKNKEQDEQAFVQIYNSFWCFTTGELHKWAGYRRMTLRGNTNRLYIFDHKPCQKTTTEFNILNCGLYSPTLNDKQPTKDACSLLGWLLADGSVSWSQESNAPSTSHGKRRGVVALITQNDNKYGKEIEELLTRMGALSYVLKRKKIGNVCRDYYIKSDWFRDYWRSLGFDFLGKHEIDMVSFILSLSKENREAYLDAFFKSDGHITCKGKGVKVITQNQNNLSESVIIAGYLSGYNISSGRKDGYYINKRGETNLCFWYKLSEKPHKTTTKMKTKVLPKGIVYNFETTGYIVCRQGDTVTSV